MKDLVSNVESKEIAETLDKEVESYLNNNMLDSDQKEKDKVA